MDPNTILHSDILDIIFEGKNKSYGAYQLRKTYNRTLTKALIYTGSLIIFIFIGTVLAGTSKKEKEALYVGPDITIRDIIVDPPTPIIPPKPVITELNQVRFVKPVIVKNNLVNSNETIEEITDDKTISIETVKSDITTHIVQAPVDDANSKVVELPVKRSEEQPFEIVQIEAGFPGGYAAWKKYLENNLDVETAINNGAPDGTYTVMVRFIVSKDGSISNVVPESNLGYGLEAEAMKVIQKGPKWVPAFQNGQQVNAYRRQPITFVVSGQ